MLIRDKCAKLISDHQFTEEQLNALLSDAGINNIFERDEITKIRRLASWLVANERQLNGVCDPTTDDCLPSEFQLEQYEIEGAASNTAPEDQPSTGEAQEEEMLEAQEEESEFARLPSDAAKALTFAYPPEIRREDRVEILPQAFTEAAIAAQVRLEAESIMGDLDQDKNDDFTPLYFYEPSGKYGPYHALFEIEAGTKLIEGKQIDVEDAKGAMRKLNVFPMRGDKVKPGKTLFASFAAHNVIQSSMNNDCIFLEVFTGLKPNEDGIVFISRIPKISEVAIAIADGLDLEIVRKSYVDVKGNVQVDYSAGYLQTSGGVSLGIRTDKINFTVKPKTGVTFLDIEFGPLLKVLTKHGAFLLKYHIGASKHSPHRGWTESIHRKGCKKILKEKADSDTHPFQNLPLPDWQRLSRRTESEGSTRKRSARGTQAGGRGQPSPSTESSAWPRRLRDAKRDRCGPRPRSSPH